MDQKNLPIHPIVDGNGIVTENPNYLQGFIGLDKLEYCAILSLQALLSNPKYINESMDELVDKSINATEKLFQKLHKDQ